MLKRTGTNTRPTKNPFSRKYTYSECESNRDSDAVKEDSKAKKPAKKRVKKGTNSDEKQGSSSEFKSKRGPYDIKKPAENWEIFVPEDEVKEVSMGDTPISFTFTCLYGDMRLAVEAMFGVGSTVHTVRHPLPRLYDAAKRIAMSPTKMKETGAAACVISLDTEYVSRGDGTNDLVSVQMTIAHCSGKLVQVLIKPTKRPKFGALVDFAYMLLGIEGRRLTDSGWTVPWRTLADVEKAQEAADGLHKLDKRATFEAMELAIRGIRITDIKSEYARAVRRAVARGHCGWHTLDIEHPAFTMTKQQKQYDKNQPLLILPRNRFTEAYVTACAEMLSNDPDNVRKLVDAILEPETVGSQVAAPVVVCAEPRSGEGTNHATAPVREQSDRGRSRKGAVRKPPSRPRKPVSFPGGARGGGCVVVNTIRRRRGI